MKKILFTILTLTSLLVLANCHKDQTPPTAPAQTTMTSTARAETVLVYTIGDLAQANTLYILQNDIVADGTAFSIGASNLSFDLNGHTITYGNAGGTGVGIRMSQWNKDDIEVFNGSIIQSVNVSETDEALQWQSPIWLNNPSIRSNGHFHHLYLEYRSAHTDGIYMNYGENNTVNDCVINDVGTVIVNRHSYRGAIAVAANNHPVNSPTGVTNIYNNTIQRCRQGGILVGWNTNVYNNNITMESVATNAMGIACYERGDLNIYENTIRGTGMHCIGIGVISGGYNIEAWENDIEVQTTEYNPEYGSTHSAAWRTTWDGYTNVKVHNNRFVGYAEAGLLPGGLDSQTWVVWCGMPVTGSEMHFYDNTIIADNKGTGAEAGAVCIISWNGVDTDLRFENNIIESNYTCVYLGTDYGGSNGFPLFKNNTFRKMSGAQEFYTIQEDINWPVTPSTARFVDNNFQGDTGFEDMRFAWNAAGYQDHSPPWCGQPQGALAMVDIRKAWEYQLRLVNIDTDLMPGMTVEIRNSGDELVFSGKTGMNGMISLNLDEYALINCDIYPDPAYVTRDFLAPGAHKIDYNPYQVVVTNGTAVYTSWQLNIDSNTYQGVKIVKGSPTPPYDISKP